VALAEQSDVEARLRRSLTTVEALSIDADLEDASAEVIGYCRRDFEPSPYPAAVVGAVAKMVARSYARSAAGEGAFVEQQNSGPFGVRYSAASSVGDVWLTAGDKLALRPYRVGGGMVSVGLVGERYSIVEDDEES
jgi:hypothetical protein